MPAPRSHPVGRCGTSRRGAPFLLGGRTKICTNHCVLVDDGGARAAWDGWYRQDRTGDRVCTPIQRRLRRDLVGATKRGRQATVHRSEHRRSHCYRDHSPVGIDILLTLGTAIARAHFALAEPVVGKGARSAADHRGGKLQRISSVHAENADPDPTTVGCPGRGGDPSACPHGGLRDYSDHTHRGRGSHHNARAPRSTAGNGAGHRCAPAAVPDHDRPAS